MQIYKREEKIGRGAMGDVYAGRHLMLDRPVAIKVIKAALAEDEEFVQRFFDEARRTARFDHPNIVRVYDVGIDPGSGLPCMVMEKLTGWTLQNRIKQQGALPVADALKIADATLSALQTAHSQQIVHRDIKPGNIFLCDDGGIKVMDFGIARALDEEGLTSTGVQMGTPEYMSPEQIRGDKVDARSDLYCVGILLYEMLSGDVPFRSDTRRGVQQQHLVMPLPPLPPNVPAWLRAIVSKATGKQAPARFATAAAMREALQRQQISETPVAPDLQSPPANQRDNRLPEKAGPSMPEMPQAPPRVPQMPNVPPVTLPPLQNAPQASNAPQQMQRTPQAPPPPMPMVPLRPPIVPPQMYNPPQKTRVPPQMQNAPPKQPTAGPVLPPKAPGAAMPGKWALLALAGVVGVLFIGIALRGKPASTSTPDAKAATNAAALPLDPYMTAWNQQKDKEEAEETTVNNLNLKQNVYTEPVEGVSALAGRAYSQMCSNELGSAYKNALQAVEIANAAPDPKSPATAEAHGVYANALMEVYAKFHKPLFLAAGKREAERCIQLDPKCDLGYSAQGNGLYLEGSALADTQQIKAKCEEALLKTQQAIDLNPNRAYFYNLRGNINYQLSGPSDAEADYKEALQRDPELEWAHLTLAYICIAQKRINEIPPHYKAINDNSKAEGFFLFALVALNQNALGQKQSPQKECVEEALSLYNKAIDLNYNYPTYHLKAAQCLDYLRRSQEAKVEARKAKELGIEDDPIYKTLNI